MPVAAYDAEAAHEKTGPQGRHLAGGGFVMSEPADRPSVVPLIWYDKPRAAIDWLQAAFGFEATMVVSDGDEEASSTRTSRSAMAPSMSSARPRSGQGGARLRRPGGRNTQSVCVNLTEGLDATARRARAGRRRRSGASRPTSPTAIGSSPASIPRATAGRFAQPAKVLYPQEMAAATGKTIETKEGAHG
jgi:uncharacterized glyoxalase superfamily protein PhnB